MPRRPRELASFNDRFENTAGFVKRKRERERDELLFEYVLNLAGLIFLRVIENIEMAEKIQFTASSRFPPKQQFRVFFFPSYEPFFACVDSLSLSSFLNDSLFIFRGGAGFFSGPLFGRIKRLLENYEVSTVISLFFHREPKIRFPSSVGPKLTTLPSKRQ